MQLPLLRTCSHFAHIHVTSSHSGYLYIGHRNHRTRLYAALKLDSPAHASLTLDVRLCPYWEHSRTCDHLDPPSVFQIQDGGAPQRYTGTHLLAYTSISCVSHWPGILVNNTPRLHKRQPSASANIFVDHVRPSRRYDGSQVQFHPASQDEHLKT